MLVLPAPIRLRTAHLEGEFLVTFAFCTKLTCISNNSFYDPLIGNFAIYFGTGGQTDTPWNNLPADPVIYLDSVGSIDIGVCVDENAEDPIQVTDCSGNPIDVSACTSSYPLDVDENGDYSELVYYVAVPVAGGTLGCP
jgi:hypothetical protein